MAPEKYAQEQSMVAKTQYELSASDLDVGSDDLMTEEVTLAVEQLVRDK